MPLLLLWDIDHTLVTTTRFDRRAYLAVATRLLGTADPVLPPSGAGRTEPHTMAETLRLNGADPGGPLVGRALELFGDLVAGDPGGLRAQGRVLPGAREAMAAAAALPGVRVGVATGNLRSVARAKLAAFGLDRHVEWGCGGYGDTAATKAGVVLRARHAAGLRAGREFPAGETLLVGDSPADAAVAAAGYARVLGVATGRADAGALARAGADAVLADLCDTRAFTAAVLSFARHRVPRSPRGTAPPEAPGA
ncbi:HAD family hydrolase [Nocardiopsis tropica]|uniref:Haloacid dehalogenase-like hydrolase n=2 Tax=Nocardiopsis tropica TaxID=109330 RepID=A0ABU7KZ62_9ACTN|nr:haloacid dehalogenase-like hydrolase [Nocardiopsis umidischolae]MEE2054352.1 haloacid dehalogenase-like hydrolase [Nocardiopsis umidischolae]